MKLLLCEPKACTGVLSMAQRPSTVGRRLSSKLEVEGVLGRSYLLFSYLAILLRPWRICKQPGEVGDTVDIRVLSLIIPRANHALSVSQFTCLPAGVLSQVWVHSLEVQCLLPEPSSLVFTSLSAQDHRCSVFHAPCPSLLTPHQGNVQLCWSVTISVYKR